MRTVHDHAHGSPPGADRRRRLTLTLVLAAGYMVAEAVGGWWTGSLALLADANHMLSDVAALSLALFAAWVVDRPAGSRWTYGRARAEVLAALAQGVALAVVAVLIVLEALERFAAPPPVLGAGMLAIATGGLVVNAVGLWILHGGRHASLSMRGAWLHVASDALGSVGAMTAGAAVWLFGWRLADPIASLAISALVLVSGWNLVREAVDVLMEAAPRHLDVDEIRTALADLTAVAAVHDLHVWTIGSGETSLSCHLVSQSGVDNGDLLTRAYELLGSRFDIGHATIQIEPTTFADESPRSICRGTPCD
ncbi:MAG: cation diffusion facilitator family transporter [Proteobacteria bacterium]|nr:cation diffusion facilitator family transporter [Pseudomonadota bacterium]